MAYKIEINKDEGIIDVKSYGIVTAETLKKQMNEISNLGIRKNIFLILVDATEQLELPSREVISEFMSKLPGYFIYATYATPGQKTKDDLIFGKSISLENGVVVQHFPSRDKALLWLKTFSKQKR